MRVTIREIADKCGLAQSSVRNILSSGGNYSEKTRILVHKVAAESGYFPSRLPSALKKGSAAAVGIILRRLADSHDVQLLDSLLARFADDGMDVMVEFAEWRSREDALRRFQFFTGWGFQALVLSSFAEITREEIIPVTKRSFVVTLRHEPWPGVSCVTLDFGVREKLALDHLLQLGHRRIGVLCYNTAKTDSGRKLETLNNELKKHGLFIAAQDVFASGDRPSDRISDRAFMLREFAAKGAQLAGLSPDKRPTAIVSFYDVNAVSFLAGFTAGGGRVPDDISLVSYNDTVVAESSMPPITTVGVAPEKIADEVVKLVKKGIGIIRSERPVMHVRLKPVLQLRATTGPRS